MHVSFGTPTPSLRVPIMVVIHVWKAVGLMVLFGYGLCLGYDGGGVGSHVLEFGGMRFFQGWEAGRQAVGL